MDKPWHVEAIEDRIEAARRDGDPGEAARWSAVLRQFTHHQNCGPDAYLDAVVSRLVEQGVALKTARAVALNDLL